MDALQKMLTEIHAATGWTGPKLQGAVCVAGMVMAKFVGHDKAYKVFEDEFNHIKDKIKF